jgi:transposase
MIASDGSRVLMPKCGVSYLDFVSVAGMNQRAAAKRLGVSERNFGDVVRRLGMSHWYPDTRPRSRCISRDDIIKVAGEGWTRRDAAHILGVSYGYLRNLIEEWKLQSYFISKAQAARVAQVGYAA